MKFSNLSRIYTTSRISKNQTITLNDSTIYHYYKSVLKIRTFQKIRLFNSIDGEFEGLITKINKKNVIEIFTGKKLREVEQKRKLVLIMCIIKPNRFVEAIKGAVQQGVTKIIPFISERTQFKTLNHSRFNRCIIETVEQSEGFTIPSLELPIYLEELNILSKEIDQLIFANENENTSIKISSIKEIKENVAVLIGPEGGFSEVEEKRIMTNPKVISISLGNKVLRSEIAAISVIACINLIRD